MLSKHTGAMNILMVLIIGSLMSGLAFSLYMNTSSGQQRTQTVHAVTHSQSGVWLATNAVKAYINDSSVEQLQTLFKDQPDQLDIEFDKGNIEAKFFPAYNFAATGFNTSSEEFPDAQDIQIAGRVSYKDQSARSSSGMFVVFKRESKLEEGTPSSNGFKMFGDVEASSQTKFLNDNSTELFVVGSIDSTLNDALKEGIKTLKTTGAISIEALNDSELKSIHSNESVNIKNSTLTLDSITSTGDISIENAFVKDVHANGSITFDSGQSYGSLRTAQIENSDGDIEYGNITVTRSGGGNEDLLADNKFIIQSNGTATIRSSAEKVTKIEAKGNITLNGDRKHDLESAISYEGDISCEKDFDNLFSASTPGAFPTLTALGSISNCTTEATQNEGTEQTFTPVEEVEHLTVENKPIINATAYIDEANYVFKQDPNFPEVILVKLQNIGVVQPDSSVALIPKVPHGLAEDKIDADGFNYEVNAKGYACPKYSEGGCTSKTAVLQICKSELRPCLSVKINSYKNIHFTIDATADNKFDNVPGVYYFEGVLSVKSTNNLENGFIGNTFIATHNISAIDGASPGIKIASVNFTGQEAVCAQTDSPHIKTITTHDNGTSTETFANGQHATSFNHVIPTNYCGNNNDTFIPRRLGNIALLAGHSPSGILDSNGVFTDYKGGNIRVENSIIYGTVLAGNRFENMRNNTTIWGNLMTLNNLCDIAKTQCNIKNNISYVTLRSNEMADDSPYDIASLPTLDDCEPDEPCNNYTDIGGTGEETTESSILWARYQ